MKQGKLFRSIETGPSRNGRNRPVALPSDRDEAPNGWRWVALSEVARLESGHTPSRRRPEWWGGNIPWLALPDIRSLDGRTASETLEYTNTEGLKNSSARLLPAGTVALSRTASVGFVTVFGKAMATSQDFFNWVCGEDLEPWFLAHALMESRGYLQSLASGAVHKTIYMSTAQELMLCMPARPEQQRIAKKLDEARTLADAATAAYAKAIDQLTALKASTSRAAFAGDI